MIKIQQLAASIVDKVLAGRSLTDVLSWAWIHHTELSAKQRAAIQDLSYGVLRHLGELEALLALLLTKPITGVQLHRLLLVALYQLRYTRAAPHAVVDYAVTATVAIAPRAQGLVNAVLRNFLRKREQLLQQAGCKEEGRYSYPQWWIDKIKVQYPAEFKRILDAGNEHPPMSLRVNRRKIEVNDYCKHLEKAGIASVKQGNDAIILARPMPLDRLPGFQEGWASVQDAGAQLAAYYLDLRPNQMVLDACAAPGGKTAHILELGDVELTALDIDETRLQRVRQNLSRLSLGAKLVCADASHPEVWWDGKPFDRILLDAPCTASGVVRRHPDIKWLRRKRDIDQMAIKQSQVLDALWRVLAGGGKLLYSTCSVFFEENQMQISRFRERHLDARVVALGDGNRLTIQLLPEPGHDGFFYALLQKS